MKKSIKHFAAGLLPLLFLFACSKDFTEKSPNDSVPVDKALNTEADMQAAVNGLYASMRSAALFGNALLVEGDLLADNSFVRSGGTGRYISSYQYNFVAEDAELGQIWQGAYTSILNANFIINAKPATPKALQLKAQALAARGLLYFKLVNLYARPYTDNPNGLGVPLVLTYEPYRLPARASVAEVYAQILKDLQTAAASAPEFTSSITINKWAVEALLAKVYLYMGNKSEARTRALNVMNSRVFVLVPYAGFADYWSNPAAQPLKIETLFELDANETSNNGVESIGFLYTGYKDVYASKRLYDLYTATDVRRSLLLPSGTPSYTVNKYPNAQNADPDNIKVIRLSEVFLIAAEASLPANETEARKYLDSVAKYRDPFFAGYASATGDSLLNAIITERRKELAFEGDRFFDLNRLKRTIEREPNAGAIPAGTANMNLTIFYADKRRVLPIPQVEIRANASIAGQQNPGY